MMIEKITIILFILRFALCNTDGNEEKTNDVSFTLENPVNLVNVSKVYEKYDNTSEYSSKLRNKRNLDSCTLVAHTGISGDILSSIASIGTKSILDSFNSVSSITGIVKSFIDLNSPTTCDLMNKLDEIKNKLDDVYHNLAIGQAEIKCDIYQSSFINNMKAPLDYLYNKYLVFQKYNDNKQDFLDTCLNKQNNDGIEKLIVRLKTFLIGNEIKKFITECFQYKSKPFEMFFGQLLLKVAKLETIYVGCAVAGNSEKFMDFKSFNKEIEMLIEYYIEFVRHEFPKDKSPKGMNAVVEQLTKGLTCNSHFPVTNDEAVTKLNEDYGYWKWNVQSYSKNIIGFDQHCVYYNEDLPQCGSLFTKRVGDCTTVISYYLKSIGYSQQIDELADKIVLPSLNRWSIRDRNLATNRNYYKEIIPQYRVLKAEEICEKIYSEISNELKQHFCFLSTHAYEIELRGYNNGATDRELNNALKRTNSDLNVVKYAFLNRKWDYTHQNMYMVAVGISPWSKYTKRFVEKEYPSINTVIFFSIKNKPNTAYIV